MAFPQFMAAWNSYLENHKMVETLSQQGKKEEATKRVLGDAREQYNKALAHLATIIEVNTKGSQHRHLMPTPHTATAKY